MIVPFFTIVNRFPQGKENEASYVSLLVITERREPTLYPKVVSALQEEMK